MSITIMDKVHDTDEDHDVPGNEIFDAKDWSPNPKA
jgi:hypothetical protein